MLRVVRSRNSWMSEKQISEKCPSKGPGTSCSYCWFQPWRYCACSPASEVMWLPTWKSAASSGEGTSVSLWI